MQQPRSVEVDQHLALANDRIEEAAAERRAQRASLLRRGRLARHVALAALTLPLLQQATSPTCLEIATRSIINGFFDVTTPLLIDAAREKLGLDPLPAGGP